MRLRDAWAKPANSPRLGGTTLAPPPDMPRGRPSQFHRHYQADGLHRAVAPASAGCGVGWRRCHTPSLFASDSDSDDRCRLSPNRVPGTLLDATHQQPATCRPATTSPACLSVTRSPPQTDPCRHRKLRPCQNDSLIASPLGGHALRTPKTPVKMQNTATPRPHGLSPSSPTGKCPLRRHGPAT